MAEPTALTTSEQELTNYIHEELDMAIRLLFQMKQQVCEKGSAGIDTWANIRLNNSLPSVINALKEVYEKRLEWLGVGEMVE